MLSGKVPTLSNGRREHYALYRMKYLWSGYRCSVVDKDIIISINNTTTDGHSTLCG